MRFMWIGFFATLIVSACAVQQGGKPCTAGWQCGNANPQTVSLRDRAPSITGTCTDSKCTCLGPSYGCDSCSYQIVYGSDEVSLLHPAQGKINMCNNTFGGGKCTVGSCVDSGATQLISSCEGDYHCGGAFGVCVVSECVCFTGYTCPHCQLSINFDILYGAKCEGPTSYQRGGAICKTDADCNFGRCNAIAGTSYGYCQCNTATHACGRCSKERNALISGQARCDADPPLFKPDGGTFGGDTENWDRSLSVKIRDPLEFRGHGGLAENIQSEIHYTLDGSDPTNSSNSVKIVPATSSHLTIELNKANPRVTVKAITIIKSSPSFQQFNPSIVVTSKEFDVTHMRIANATGGVDYARPLFGASVFCNFFAMLMITLLCGLRCM